MNRPAKFYRGQEKTDRLEQLADVANQHHHEAVRAWDVGLQHAKKAGDALLEAWHITGKRGKWGRWRRDNFVGSSETARVYARIARQWDHPSLVEARACGIELKSIRTVLKILRGEKLKDKDVQAKEEAVNFIRRFVLRQVGARLRDLDEKETDILAGMFPHMWDVLHAEVKSTRCAVDESWDHDLSESEKLEADRLNHSFRNAIHNAQDY